MSMNQGLTPTGPQVLFTAQTATTANGIFYISGLCARATVAIIGAGTLSTGVVTIEEAYYTPQGSPYAGTWSPITTVTASTLTGGAHTVIHIAASIWALRVRISTTVTGAGGSITAVAWGN
jgi:hypothetical protein